MKPLNVERHEHKMSPDTAIEYDHAADIPGKQLYDNILWEPMSTQDATPIKQGRKRQKTISKVRTSAYPEDMIDRIDFLAQFLGFP